MIRRRIDRWIKKTGTVAVDIGDMMKFTSSGKITPVTVDSADSIFLIGIAMNKSPVTDRTATGIRVRLIGRGTVFKMTVASSVYYYGDFFKIAGAQTLAKKAVVNIDASSTNVVAVCARDSTYETNSLLVEFLDANWQDRIVNKSR